MNESATAVRPVLLDIKNLRKYYPIRRGLLQRVIGNVKAVDDVSFHILEGETLGLVGESGCGKTTAGRCILRGIEPTGGEVMFMRAPGDMVDVARQDPQAMGTLRRNLQMIFQDPYSSLNPRWTLLEIVGEPLLVNNIAKGKELEDRVADMLKRVGLRPEFMRRYPHAFSGGERQRIGIARALAVQPAFIVCDEPVSVLDVSVQAQVLNLLSDLQRERGLSYLFIAHDLAVVRQIARRVAVMYLGRIVEEGPTEALLSRPRHPYTVALLSAVPEPDPARQRSRIVLGGDLPSPSNPPSGCPFHPRCFHPRRNERCSVEVPRLRPVGSTTAACHYAEDTPLPEQPKIP